MHSSPWVAASFPCTVQARALVPAQEAEDIRVVVAIRVVRVTWALVVAFGYCLAYALFGNAIIAALTGIESVRERAGEFLLFAVVSPIIGVWSYLFDGIFVGTTRTAEMRNGMLVSIGAYLAALYWLIPRFENYGLWTALMVFLITRALTLGAFYPRIERQLRRSEPKTER